MKQMMNKMMPICEEMMSNFIGKNEESTENSCSSNSQENSEKETESCSFDGGNSESKIESNSNTCA
ncbi:hypothetical protein [Galbibacter sp. PAP.153]|uniref:hypothetical protein n=1 Tax=Galbibacter sp. PAP.153 TaxID=3104623 RepID=UPI003009EC16